MKKVLIFTILLICSCIVNATEHQSIYVIHDTSKEEIIHKRLCKDSIIYTKNRIVKYVIDQIPIKFCDNEETYRIHVYYHTDLGINVVIYRLSYIEGRWICYEIHRNSIIN